MTFYKSCRYFQRFWTFLFLPNLVVIDEGGVRVYIIRVEGVREQTSLFVICNITLTYDRWPMCLYVYSNRCLPSFSCKEEGFVSSAQNFHALLFDCLWNLKETLILILNRRKSVFGSLVGEEFFVFRFIELIYWRIGQVCFWFHGEPQSFWGLRFEERVFVYIYIKCLSYNFCITVIATIFERCRVLPGTVYLATVTVAAAVGGFSYAIGNSKKREPHHFLKVCAIC